MRLSVLKSVLANLLILFILPQAALAQPVTNQRLYDTIPFIPEHFPRRVAQFEKEPVVTGKIVFLGNSITEMGRWDQLTGDPTAINRGISGDITFGVLKRLDDIIKRKPSKIFLLIGINDIGRDIPDAVIADNCRKIVERLQKGTPDTKIYLQSILPVNPTVRNFPQHYDKEGHVIATNKLLKLVAQKTGCTYVNLFPFFLNKDKLMNEKYTLEGLHLNPEGYKVWINYLKEKGYL